MTIGFLHTPEVHTATFSGLLDELSPGRPSRHVVDQSLEADARERAADHAHDAFRTFSTVVVEALDIVPGPSRRRDRRSSPPAPTVRPPSDLGSIRQTAS